MNPEKGKPSKTNDQGATIKPAKPATPKPEKPQAKPTGTGDFWR